MAITRKQFDILEALLTSSKKMSQRELSECTSYSLGTINQVMKELAGEDLIEDGVVTEAGKEAMEPYRVKRAILMAAGFGSRMVPVTLNTPKPLVRVHGVRIMDRLIDACLAAGIEEIYVVRGYLAEQFDQLLYKYPMVKFIENPAYNEANSISSFLVARELLCNAYVFESDLLLHNPAIIKKYNYMSNMLGIKKERTDDFCFKVKNKIIVDEVMGGEGDDIWQVVGVAYWDNDAGQHLVKDLVDVYEAPGGKERYWEMVPLVYKKENYNVEVRECKEEDIVEIDSFKELKQIDKTYDV